MCGALWHAADFAACIKNNVYAEVAAEAGPEALEKVSRSSGEAPEKIQKLLMRTAVYVVLTLSRKALS